MTLTQLLLVFDYYSPILRCYPIHERNQGKKMGWLSIGESQPGKTLGSGSYVHLGGYVAGAVSGEVTRLRVVVWAKRWLRSSMTLSRPATLLLALA